MTKILATCLIAIALAGCANGLRDVALDGFGASAPTHPITKRIIRP